ncbi:MAG TPA: molybdopterin-binding protein [Pseudoflavonifractor sp.]|nr:molybdopterin-binding protein [Pseudoflavonifractor sp.]
MGVIRAICISEKKGTQKHAVPSARLVEDWGIEGDAHAGNWHRQVSLLSLEKIDAFRARGAEVDFGAFGENLVVEGFDFRALPVGTRFSCGEALLEMTQIGKECHTHCNIYKVVGDCIMPREGVFARVLRGGVLTVGDELTLIPRAADAAFRAAVVTLSDKGFRGARVDESGPILREMLQTAGYEVVEEVLLPDERSRIETELIRLADGRQCDLVLTTGGTGFSPRDCTPEATMAVATRNAPGIAEAIRAYSMKITDRAMLSRGASVLRGGTLIVNLPGSPKAAREGLECILPSLRHGLEILRGTTGECAR